MAGYEVHPNENDKAQARSGIAFMVERATIRDGSGNVDVKELTDQFEKVHAQNIAVIRHLYNIINGPLMDDGK